MFKKLGVLGTACCVALMLLGCNNDVLDQTSNNNQTFSASKKEGAFVENKKVYANDRGDQLSDLYVTVLPTDKAKMSFDDMNHMNVENASKMDPNLNIIFQEGDAKGPLPGMIGYSEDTANASIELRGQSSRVSIQKSYKIKLEKKAGLWNEQRNINLNKHSLDMTRVRNKLSFDYFSLFDNINGLRTRFVHLHVKDLSSGNKNSAFEDYGLYTQVEQPNSTFLQSRSLDTNGNLYKAQFFEFLRYPEVIKNSFEKEYDKSKFDEILEIHGSEDHRKLIEMLDDVNNSAISTKEVIDKHFNRENLLTWLASNILMGNVDTSSRNFYLYRPVNSDKWYILPWDYDKAWGYFDGKEVAKWQQGLPNYWGMPLFNRFLKDADNVKALTVKIEELSKIMNKDQTKKFLDSYRNIVGTFVHQEPDISHLPFEIDNWEPQFNGLIDIVDNNKKSYYEDLENPMPFFLGEPQIKDGTITFNWDHSYDLQGDDLTYTFQVSRDMDFTNILKEEKNTTKTSVSYELKDFKQGEYYWKTVVKDSKGHDMGAFDFIVGADKIYRFGVKELRIP